MMEKCWSGVRESYMLEIEKYQHQQRVAGQGWPRNMLGMKWVVSKLICNPG